MILRKLLVAAATLLSLQIALPAQQWVPPSPDELSLSSVPQAPGAPAIYLFREQVTEDKLHMFSVHARLKVLTAGGLDRANVEIRYLAGNRGISLDELAGRTIHPDGTIVNFTGKPYDKLIEKLGNQRYMAKVFSLPDVTPGSILEYRYKLRYDDGFYISPNWDLQDDLFTRKVHYFWRPTDQALVTGDDRHIPIHSYLWTAILPPGVAVKERTDGFNQVTFELTANDIPATIKEEHAPPLSSFSYRVLFYLSPYNNGQEFWAKEGKYWSKQEDKFIGPGSAIRAAARELTAGANTPDAELRKLYNAVQGLENTDNTREHTSTEDRAAGLKAVRNTDDILGRKRGSGDQLALLFVALARAAGFDAYAMQVTSRDRSLFYPEYLTLGQFNDTIAIVSVNGKDEFFDPGTHLCPFQELSWPHQQVEGLRQTAGGNSALVSTPGNPFRNSHTTRIADLTLDEHGVATGSLTLTFTGSPALNWRQRYSSEDETAVRQDLTRSVQDELPASLVINLTSLDNLGNPDQPLTAKFTAHGPVGSAAGKRLLLPASLFHVNARPMFPSATRKLAVDMRYAFFQQDAVRFKLPPNLVLESAPANAKLGYKQLASFDMNSQTAPGSITVRRNSALGTVLFLPAEYSDLRTYHQGMEAADNESIVLKQTPTTAGVNTPPTPTPTPN